LSAMRRQISIVNAPPAGVFPAATRPLISKRTANF
jgi:hypothetical protein